MEEIDGDKGEAANDGNVPQDVPVGSSNADTSDFIENETLENPAEVDINECFMNRTEETGMHLKEKKILLINNF